MSESNIPTPNHPGSELTRNSTFDFLSYALQSGEQGVEVRVQNETVWLSQKAMGILFERGSDNIGLHLKNIFKEGELDPGSVTEDFSVTASDSKTYTVKHYNLDAIISVGYRINSTRATLFRQWATKVLRLFAVQGYVLDKDRLKRGQVFDREYFDALLEDIREIRASERLFYQKVTDIYATSSDYNPQATTTREFFANVQNKLHFAIHQHTAAEMIVERADHKKSHMGLTSWRNGPAGKIIRSDVSIAKNYLSEIELSDLEQLVTLYLEYAERQARRRIPMTMQDWKQRLEIFLNMNEEAVLEGIGKVSSEIAKSFAESEFEKYRVIQDKEFQSDFDKLVMSVSNNPDAPRR